MLPDIASGALLGMPPADREQAMNKDIRRAAQVEAMQARYAELAQRKAAEAAEQARLRKLQEAVSPRS